MPDLLVTPSPTLSQAVDIIVPQVTQAPMQPNLHPIMDFAPFMGWPIWIWVFIIMGVVLLIVWLRWLRKRMIMAPVLSYLESLKGGKREDMQTWMIGKNKSFFIEHLKYNDDGVISYWKFLINISMWYLGSSLAVGHAGGIKSVIVSDNYDMVRDPVAEMALCAVVDEFNDMNKEPVLDAAGMKRVDEFGQELYHYPISNYADYEQHRADLENLHPEGIKIPSYAYFNVMNAQKLMPPNRTAGMFGADCIREARKKNIDQAQASIWEKFLPLGVALAISIIAIIVTYMYTSAR
jgi:hypothetical protein